MRVARCLFLQVSELVQLVENAAVPDILLQYPSVFQLHASYDLLASSAGIQQGIQSTLRALNPPDDKFDIIVISGAVGAGKTRLGFEMLRLLGDPFGAELAAFKAVAEERFLAVTLFIDLNNGMAYDDDIDTRNMDQNMAVRLAARVLDRDMNSLKDAMKWRSLRGLSTAAVLDAIVTGALRQADDHTEDGELAKPVQVVVLVLHLDEYQFYMRSLLDSNLSRAVVRRRFKKMLSCISNYARTTRRSDGVRVTILPVLSGTPLTGLELLSSDKLVEVPIQPGTLSAEDAATLVADVITKPTNLRHLRGKVKEVLQNQVEARIALADMDCRPRYLVSLGVFMRKQLKKSAKTATAVEFLDWHAASTEVVNTLLGVRVAEVSRYETLVRLVLSQAPVRRFLAPHDGMSDAEKIVYEAAADGLVGVQRLGGDYDRVVIPLVQLRKWGLSDVIPARLINTAAFTWRDAEVVLAYCIKALLEPELRSLPLTLRSMFPGALGAQLLPDSELIIDRERKVYQEIKQYISQSSPAPAKELRVRAFGERLTTSTAADVNLRDGVFLTCGGNLAVDVRATVPMRLEGGNLGDCHLVAQSKHTTVDDAVSVGDITRWYEEARAALAAWKSDKDHVLYVFFTNKRLSKSAMEDLSTDFFLAHPSLCVISADQLGAVIPACLTTRVLLSPPED